MKAKTYPETSADKAYRELNDILAAQAEHAPQQVRDVWANRTRPGHHYVQFSDNRYFAHPMGDFGVYDFTQRRVLSLKRDYEVITDRSTKGISVKYRDPQTGELKVGNTGYFILVRDLYEASGSVGEFLMFFMR